MVRCASFLMVVWASSACATPPEARTEAIVHGTPESEAPWVVMVVQPVPGTTRVRLCSGAVVAPRAVLTAKHCVYRLVAGSTTWVAVPPAELTVHTGTRFHVPSDTVSVTAVRTTEGPYRDDDGRSGGDIAVLTLAEPLPIAPKRLSSTPAMRGDRVRILGFGYTRPGATDPSDLGTLHRGEATVQTVENYVFSTTGAQWTCTGDSGGPALHLERDELLGVVSIGPTGCRVSTSYYTRIDQYLSLFEGLVPLPAQDAGMDPSSDAASTATDVAPVDATGILGAMSDGGCRVRRGALPGRSVVVMMAMVSFLLGRRRRRAVASGG